MAKGSSKEQVEVEDETLLKMGEDRYAVLLGQYTFGLVSRMVQKLCPVFWM